ncbi:hypothetical protein N9N28_01650 [Rubripirellula amarantea]|uniref:hypothetical protein n=1 Tax=Rubripirellula amarantea TaxID=2527999 RepID=UPI0013EF4C4A|nr:hypothetical protein [Rubripirellula amarantea]MDA8743312.1 hypothetical protein [Rubripirellula amarantea]
MSETKFAFIVALVVCPITYFCVRFLGPMGALAIMLVPIAFTLRSPTQSGRSSPDEGG